jgi:4-oxalocrotonate tautomerase
MPTIRIDLFEGRSPEMKKALVKELTEATVRVLVCPAASVDIILNEVKKSDWATGGQFWSEKT